MAIAIRGWPNGGGCSVVDDGRIVAQWEHWRDRQRHATTGRVFTAFATDFEDYAAAEALAAALEGTGPRREQALKACGS